MDGGGRHQMIVVKDEHQWRRKRRQLVEKKGKDRFRRWRLGCAQQLLHTAAKLRLLGLQGGNQIGEKTGRVVVVVIQRQPGDWVIGLGDPLANEGRFAKAGRCGDQGAGVQ